MTYEQFIALPAYSRIRITALTNKTVNYWQFRTGYIFDISSINNLQQVVFTLISGSNNGYLNRKYGWEIGEGYCRQGDFFVMPFESFKKHIFDPSAFSIEVTDIEGNVINYSTKRNNYFIL